MTPHGERGRERTTPVVVHRLAATTGRATPDVLAVEEPLAIRLAADDRRVELGVTMRTPGDDPELAVGWLTSEGLLADRRDVRDVSWCVRDDGAAQHHNAVTVTVRGPLPDLSRLDRRGVVTSACGVCGRTSVEDLAARGVPPVDAPLVVDEATLFTLPRRLRAAQETFSATGGLHAAARFDADGRLLALREDVGRHNALDKLVGAALLDGDLPWSDQILVLSGRASYELLAKAAVAGVGVVAAIGPPSSLAVEVAVAFGITLVGFLRADRGNAYTHAHRVLPTAAVRS